MKLSLPEFTNSRVLVIGDVMLDRYWYGATARISPEAPVPVVTVADSEERPGGAGNVALNIAALGGHATVLGLVGQDEAAQSLSSALQAHGVVTHLQASAAHATITKLRVISRHQQLLRLDFEDGFVAAQHADLVHQYQQQLHKHQAVIISDYGKGTLHDIPELIRLARQADTPVLIDPKGTDFSRYQHASLITPNQAEFEAVVGRCDTEADFIAKGQALIQELDLQSLLITRSEKGMLLLRNNAEPLSFAANAKDVYDVTGAGDTVIAVLAAGLAADMPLSAAVQLANLAAGVVVGKLGTATASVDELQAAMHTNQPVTRGVLSAADLLTALAAARAAGERIVMTNGCFDILHAGHVAYLAQAKDLGDRLLVAVNDDASVKRLKGPARPVNPLQQRMQVLAALASVDWVVSFVEDTPEHLISTVLPDVLVKGGDYQVTEIVGAQQVQQAGGEVVVLDYLDGCSSSAIIDAIQKI